MKIPAYIAEYRYLPVVAAILVMGTKTPSIYARTPVIAPAVAADSTAPRTSPWSRDTLVGRSGKLWMKLLSAKPGDSTGILSRLFGDSVTARPGVYAVRGPLSSGASRIVTAIRRDSSRSRARTRTRESPSTFACGTS
jgi:hypothetical protein